MVDDDDDDDDDNASLPGSIVVVVGTTAWVAFVEPTGDGGSDDSLSVSVVVS